MQTLDWREGMKQEWRKDGLRITGSEELPASNPLNLDIENLVLLIQRGLKTPLGQLEELFPLGE